MMNERSATITLDGEQFELLLTTRATKEIAARYGGLEELGDKLMRNENFETALDEVVWLLALLANQPIQIHNLKNKENKRELLTTDYLELLTSPTELAGYKNAISEAMFKGTVRNVESAPPELAPTEKNAQAE
jgi:hypothetical protein